MINIIKKFFLCSFLLVIITSLEANFDTGDNKVLLESSRELVVASKEALKDWGFNRLSKAFLYPLQQAIARYKDPRLIGLLTASGIITTGGVYLLCKKNKTTYDKIASAACIGFGVANIILSHYVLGLADSYFPKRF